MFSFFFVSFFFRAAQAEVKAAIQSKSFSPLGVFLSAGGQIGPKDFGFSLNSTDPTFDTTDTNRSSPEGASTSSPEDQNGPFLKLREAAKKPVKWAEKFVDDLDLFGGKSESFQGDEGETLGEKMGSSQRLNFQLASLKCLRFQAKDPIFQNSLLFYVTCFSLFSPSDLKKEEPQNLEPWQKLQPKLTMLGVAVQGPAGSLSEADIKEAMVTAAREFEEKMKSGDGAMPERGPLFIADLGEPLGQEREASRAENWDADEPE